MARFKHARVSLLMVGAIYSCACSGGAEGEGGRSTELDNASAPVELTCPASEQEVIDLGSFGPTQSSEPSTAVALNDYGTVVGLARLEVSPGQTEARAFRWKPDTGMVALATLGGTSSWANDVNNADQVAGTSRLPNGDAHAVVWDAEGRIRDLGTFGGHSSSANGINNRGQVVGVAADAIGERGFIWDAKTGMVDMELPRSAKPAKINDFGVVVGTSDVKAFKWTKNEGLTLLDQLGATFSLAWGINNLAEAVGSAQLGNERFGVRWAACGGSRVAALPNAMETFPRAINDRGLMVGTGSPPISLTHYEQRTVFVAAQWESTNRVAPLPLEATSSSANDVNNCGDVVGERRIPGRDWRAYLWHPQRQSQ